MSKSWTSYKRQQITENYDTIVIGSGLGGLSTAAFLAKKGKRVLVLEKHYVAGGFTHVFKRKKYEWDVGLHYVGEVNRPKTFLYQLFSYVTNGQLQWAEMDDVYDKIIIAGKQYDYVKGSKPFADKMKLYFPGEEKAIDEYLKLINETSRAAAKFFSEKALPPFMGSLLGFFMKRKFLKYSDKTTLEVLQSLTSNKELIAVLAAQYGDYGMPPSNSSFAIHAMVAKHYLNGGAYPIGGSQRIAETIYPIIKNAGGEVLVNAGVKQIIIKDNKAIGVLMEDGNEIFAPIIISNVGIENTYKQLLAEPITTKHHVKEKLNQLQPSSAHVCLYIGINESWRNLNLGNANFWIYPHYDHDKAITDFRNDHSSPLPVVYISFPSAKDPDWENRYPGKCTVEIITVAQYDWFKKWEDARWRKRGEEYDELKEQFSQRLLEQLYIYVPQLKGKVDYYELSSPLSTKNFTSYASGEIYGVDHTPHRFRQNFLRAHTPIKNLFLTGQDIVTVGIGGALFSGLITSSAILNKNLVEEVRNQQPIETKQPSQPLLVA